MKFIVWFSSIENKKNFWLQKMQFITIPSESIWFQKGIVFVLKWILWLVEVQAGAFLVSCVISKFWKFWIWEVMIKMFDSVLWMLGTTAQYIQFVPQLPTTFVPTSVPPSTIWTLFARNDSLPLKFHHSLKNISDSSITHYHHQIQSFIISSKILSFKNSKVVSC
jgi:hypothetical protein